MGQEGANDIIDGAVSGAWANVVVKYTEQKDMKSKRENKTSFIFL